MEALLRVAGALCMLVGIGLAIVGFARQPATRAAGHVQVQATAGPYAPVLSTGLYAQNRFYRASAALAGQTTLRYAIETRFTERLTIGFDRPVATCLASQGGTDRPLHVFPIAGVPGYAAIAFFSTAKRIAAGESVVCTLAEPASSARTDGAALAPLDPIVARHRLEYAAHANLIGLSRALFALHDPALRRVPLSVAP
jgi:hypothetical protein